jgi:hypothetical protein
MRRSRASICGGHDGDISRVSSLSPGGVFIDADDPASVAQTLEVQFRPPNGWVLGKAVVRLSVGARAFTELPEVQRAALSDPMQTLLGTRRNGSDG